jgi:hypothetical protein
MPHISRRRRGALVLQRSKRREAGADLESSGPRHATPNTLPAGETYSRTTLPDCASYSCAA